MRQLTHIIAIFLLAGVAFGADVKPVNPGTPVLRVFIGIPAKDGGEGMTFDNAHPLLVVSTVYDAVLGQDRKGVGLQLNANDAKTFAALTRQYPKGFLIFEAQGRVLEAWHIKRPIDNGILGFQYPEHATTADYLRKRFRLGEFK